MIPDLSTCRDTVKRVVLTSSVAAIRSGKSPAAPVNPPLYSDKDWNEVRDALLPSDTNRLTGTSAHHDLNPVLAPGLVLATNMLQPHDVGWCAEPALVSMEALCADCLCECWPSKRR